VKICMRCGMHLFDVEGYLRRAAHLMDNDVAEDYDLIEEAVGAIGEGSSYDGLKIRLENDRS